MSECTRFIDISFLALVVDKQRLYFLALFMLSHPRSRLCLNIASYIGLLWMLQLIYCSFVQVGWWAGVSEGNDDPYGRIINISPAEGRFIAKGYSARWGSGVGGIESISK